MKSKELIKVWKAISACASDDKTRTIGRVRVVSATRIEATDGHVLIRWDASAPHGLAVGLYDPKKALALLRAGVTPVPEQTQDRWPDTDAVLASAEGERTPASCVGFDAALLGTLADAVAVASGERHGHVQVHLGSSLDPAIIRAEGANGAATGLIMPVKI